MEKNRVVGAVGALIVTLMLGGCASLGSGGMTDGAGAGSTPSSTETPLVGVQGEFNAADSMFAMMMIPHHEQAVEMSEAVLGREGIDPQVAALAQEIMNAQAPEITLMQGWLTEWGMPEAGDGMHMGDGMMSESDLTALEAADGDEASRLYLEQMIQHHEGAIDMAQVELAGGVNSEALALAQGIVETQSVEIATMQGLLEQK